MPVRIRAGQDRRARRRAQRRGDERVAYMRTALRHAVHVGRLHERMPHEAHRVEAVVVAEDEDHIAWRNGGLGGGDADVGRE